MAKRKKIKFEGPTVGSPDKDYQVREDADRIKRYAELRSQESRHKAAMDHIDREHAGVLSLGGVRAPARAGRKRSMRRRLRGRA